MPSHARSSPCGHSGGAHEGLLPVCGLQQLAHVPVAATAGRTHDPGAPLPLPQKNLVLQCRALHLHGPTCCTVWCTLGGLDTAHASTAFRLSACLTTALAAYFAHAFCLSSGALSALTMPWPVCPICLPQHTPEWKDALIRESMTGERSHAAKVCGAEQKLRPAIAPPSR